MDHLLKSEREQKLKRFATSLPRLRAANGIRTFSARQHVRSVRLCVSKDHKGVITWRKSDDPSELTGKESLFLHPLINLKSVNEAIGDITASQQDAHMLEFTQVYLMESVNVYGKLLLSTDQNIFLTAFYA